MSVSPKVSRKNWPGVAIPGTRILEACADGDFTCPQCAKVVSARTEITFSPNIYGGMIAACPMCEWSGDPFRYYMETNRLETPEEAITALRAAKVRIPTACDKPPSIKAYQKYLGSCRAFEGLLRNMSVRRLTSIGGQPVTAMGFPMPVHKNPYWWCMTLTELRYHLGNHTTSTGTEGWSSAIRAAGSTEAPVVVIPEHGVGGVVGVWIVGENESTKRVGYGADPGLGLGGIDPDPGPVSWNGTRIVTPSVLAAVGLTAASMRDHNRVPPVALVDNLGSDFVRRTLKGTAGINSHIVWPAVAPAAVKAETIRLARRLGARVAMIHWVDRAYTDFASYVAQNVISSAVPWLEAVEQTFNTKPDWRARAFLSDVGWDGEVVRRAKNSWTPSNYDRAENLMSSTGWSDMEITAALTVSESKYGLVDAGTDKVLYAAVPVVTKIYRSDDGRTRYAGKVRYSGREYEFDSAAFRKDPIAVLDSVFLRHGIEPPRAHPSIVPHLANIAQYNYVP